MRPLSTILLLLMILPSTAARSTAQEPPVYGLQQPSRNHLLDDLDTLFLLQDATARGHRNATLAQKRLLLSMGQKVRSEGLAETDQMTTFVVGYVLSGGDPNSAITLSRSGSLPPSHRELLEGVSYFMGGNRKDASRLLRSIDVSTLPLRVSGRVALAKAMLEDDPAARQLELSTAAALMPGTLVEESALRRSALSYAQSGPGDDLWRRLERYQRRFPESLYAKTFWEELLSGLARWRTESVTPHLARLDLVLQEMRTSRRRDLYLYLARQASSAGNIALVIQSSRRVLRLAEEGSAEEQMAKMFLAFYSVGSETSEKVLAGLLSIQRESLAPDDRAILDAGLWITRQINEPPSGGRPGLGVETPEENSLQIRLVNLLMEVDKLLTKSDS
jgi:chemotaxis protein MotC